MEAKESAAEKRTAVEYLNFGEKTARRVAWEAWEFTVISPGEVRVTNASYGYLKDDHSYTVSVNALRGRALPAGCECPADQYSDQYDCKHKVALATVGGPTVLNAAMECEPRADGGVTDTKACPNDEDWCAGAASDDLPCFACFSLEQEFR